MKHIKNYLLAYLFLAMGLSAFGQTPPVDLANMSLGDLLNAKIIRSYSDMNTFEPVQQDMPVGYLDSSRFHFSTSYLKVKFDGYMDGTKDLSFKDVQWNGIVPDRTKENFPIVPTVIKQEATQFKGAYTLSEQITLSLSIPYIRQSSEHISIKPGFEDFTIVSEGLGDIETAISWFKQLDKNNHLLLSLGISLPTGSIDETGDTPSPGPDNQLPYTMQLGSGTYDIKPSIHYFGSMGNWTFGADLNLTLRTGKNDRDYRLGNVYQAGIWTRYALTDWMQPSLRIDGVAWDEISGRDPALPFFPESINPYPAAVVKPDNFGGTKLLALVGLRLKDPRGRLENTFLELEAGAPFYQELNGPQPSEDWRFSASFVLSF
ncbi:MAG: transporter [Opitutae bacterium]|nr:transporter [Opitutae bacterium]